MSSVKRLHLNKRSLQGIPTAGLLGSGIISLYLAACGTPPRSGIQVQVTSGGPKAAVVCPAPLPGVAPSPGCEPFELIDTSKLVVKPGDAVALTGKNFRPTMTVASSAALSEPGPKVTVLSDTKAALLIPEKASFGLMDVTLTQDGVTQKVTLLSNGGKTDLPVITAGADQICQGTKFYDLAGAVQEGTKNCAVAAALPTCQTDGQVGCMTTKDTPAIVKAAIDPTNLRAGVNIVGVIGTLVGTPPSCTLDGETGCLATASFKAADMSRVSSGNIKSGIAIAGVVGSLSAPATCSANGSQSCVASGTYYAAQACLTSGSSGCYVPQYTFTTQPLMAVNIDAVDTTKVRSSLTIAGRVGSLSDCATNGLSGCVTTTTYKSADLTNLTAGNVKNGINIAGTVGAYPSVGTPLSTNTATTDLTSVSPTTATGSYEFFDSAGVAYSMTVVDGGTITPSSNQQTLGAAGTFYRGAIISAVNSAPATCSANGTQDCLVSGSFYAATACAANSSNCYLPSYAQTSQPLLAINFDTIDASTIRSGTTIGGKAGSLSDCVANGTSGCVTTASFKAADLTNLAAGNIKNGVNIAGTVGTYPSVATPLAANTATPDLTSVSPTTPVGAYEFFDSAGTVRQVSVADGGTVTPSGAVQNIGAADTIYRAVTIAGDGNLQAANIRSGATIFGVAGSVTAESHSNCSANGTQGCVATGSYFAGTACSANGSACYIPTYASGTQPLLAINYDNINATQMRAALTIAGKSGSLGDCSTDGALGCVTVTGFPSARLANFSASNVQSGVAIAGVSGSLANCATDGTLGCVTVTGFPSARLANFTASNVQSGTTIAGVPGSLANCAADGGTSCVANASFTAAATSGLASKVVTGQTVAGIAGTTAGESHTNCTADGGVGCVSTASYTAAATTGLASKVLSTATVAGVVGNVTLPAVGNVFTGTQYGVSGNGSTGTLTIPTAANVRTGNGVYGVGGNGSTPTLADCSTDGTLGCVTVTGFPSARLANFTASNVQSGTTIAGVAGTIASCTSDGQTGCVSSALLPAANISGFSTWNLRIGTTLAGVSGTLKTNCRNTVNSTYFNYDGAVGSLSNSGVTSGTTADYWDTIDDYYGFPSTRVAAWSADTLCDNTTWSDVTTTNGGTSFTTCGTSSTCIYRDLISNLRVTGILASGGNTTNTTTPATYAWNAAVQTCNSSTYGGYTAGTWRLPTQKELMSLYEHGMVSLAGTTGFMTLANMQNSFWSSSTASTSTTNAWFVSLANGYTTNFTKTTSYYVVCVR